MASIPGACDGRVNPITVDPIGLFNRVERAGSAPRARRFIIGKQKA
jgi:hypothetical protein